MTNFSRKFCAKSPFKFDKYIRGKEETEETEETEFDLSNAIIIGGESEIEKIKKEKEEEIKIDLSNMTVIGGESEIEKIKKEKEEKEKETDRLIDGDLTEKERKQHLDKSFR